MRKIMLGMGIAVMILAGLALAFYPSVSNWLAERDQFSAIQEYSTALADMSAQEMEDEREKAREYNNTLTGAVIVDPFVPGSGMDLPENYMSILNVKGIMGHIEIPKIGVYLPIYHSTEESVLKKGVGHLENTALPIGGNGNHAVLTGHCGLSSARLFTDLEKLEIGDVFYLHILDETMAYRTDQILIVEPDDTSSLHPVQGEDFVTLITCTPYAINTHRLLVRGTRVPYTPEEIPEPVAPQPVADDMPEYGLWILIALSVVSILIVIEIHSLTNRLSNRRKGQKIKKTRFGIKVVVLFLVIAGMAVISFPYASQMVYKNQAATVIAAFDERAEALADDESGHLDWLYEWMMAYNKELYENKQNGLVDPFSYQQAPAFLMDLNLEDEMIGYLSVPKMDIDLPIYLGASKENLGKGAAHLTQTSLPIGGENTNVVLAAHRGMSTAAMFRDIEKLEIGDEIVITNFWETLTYHVTEIAVIRPTDISAILIQENRDLVTLITCHPYQHNYQRYVVYCERKD